MKIKSVEYIYKEPFWLKLYQKITFNKFWLFEVKFINNIAWKYIWERLRIADEKNGHCMVIVLQKNE